MTETIETVTKPANWRRQVETFEGWELRESVSGGIAYWTTAVPMVHEPYSACARKIQGQDVVNRQRVEEMLVEGRERGLAGETPAFGFCTRCVLRRTDSAASRADRAEELELHGELCPKCNVEMSLTGVCATCTDEAPVKPAKRVARTPRQRKPARSGN